MNTPPKVSPEEWEAAREQLLVKEKELTRARDAMAAERRRMPWMAIEKERGSAVGWSADQGFTTVSEAIRETAGADARSAARSASRSAA